MNESNILISQTNEKDTALAVEELHKALNKHESELVIFFCTGNYDFEILAAKMGESFGKTPVVGCETAYAIGPDGYGNHSLTGISFEKGLFTIEHDLLRGLKDFDRKTGRDFAGKVLLNLDRRDPGVSRENAFALMLIDGMSIREELVANAFQRSIGSLLLFGGSASDDLKFKETRIYYKGQFQTDCTVLFLIKTSLPFKMFMTHNFFATDKRLVVTKADASQRKVYEINGLPAAEEYAHQLGMRVDEIGTDQFADFPVIVLIGGDEYIRSIQQVNNDKSMTFYCAIDEGVVLRMAKEVDLINNLQYSFHNIEEEIGKPQATLVCDCILRNRQITHQDIQDQVDQIFDKYKVIGLSTFGEQYHGVHINQTLVGLAIGQEK